MVAQDHEARMEPKVVKLVAKRIGVEIAMRAAPNSGKGHAKLISHEGEAKLVDKMSHFTFNGSYLNVHYSTLKRAQAGELPETKTVQEPLARIVSNSGT